MCQASRASCRVARVLAPCPIATIILHHHRHHHLSTTRGRRRRRRITATSTHLNSPMPCFREAENVDTSASEMEGERGVEVVPVCQHWQVEPSPPPPPPPQFWQYPPDQSSQPARRHLGRCVCVGLFCFVCFCRFQSADAATRSHSDSVGCRAPRHSIYHWGEIAAAATAADRASPASFRYKSSPPASDHHHSRLLHLGGQISARPRHHPVR